MRHETSATWNNNEMAWDPARPVPWGRLVREWLVYMTVMAVVFVVFLRDTVTVGSVGGLLASLPMYLIAGFVLAKFGYQRKTFRDLKSAARPTSSTASTNGSTSSTTSSRSKPVATRRTSTGPSQRRPNNKRKR